MLDFLFQKKKRVPPAGEILQVDLHSHLIPGIDDGAATDDDSLTLIRGMEALGYRKVITTPHIYHDVYRNSKQNILQGLIRLQALVQQHKITMEVEAVAEYFFDEHFFRLIDNNELLMFGDKYLLFELPFTNKPAMVDDIIFQLNLAGYKPVLAHPERYPYFHDKRMQEYEKLKHAGVFFQLNLMSLTGHYGPGVKTAAQLLIQNAMVDFAGSDLHRAKQLPIVEKGMNDRHFDVLLGSGNLLNNQL